MKTVMTAVANPIINEKLKNETNIQIIGNDIQYKEGLKKQFFLYQVFLLK